MLSRKRGEAGREGAAHPTHLLGFNFEFPVDILKAECGNTLSTCSSVLLFQSQVFQHTRSSQLCLPLVTAVINCTHDPVVFQTGPISLTNPTLGTPSPFSSTSIPRPTGHLTPTCVQGPQEHFPVTATHSSTFFLSEKGILVLIANKVSNGGEHFLKTDPSHLNLPQVYEQTTLGTKTLSFYLTMLSVMSGCSGFIPLDMLLPSEIQTPNYQVKHTQRPVLIWHESTILVRTWA